MKNKNSMPKSFFCGFPYTVAHSLERVRQKSSNHHQRRGDRGYRDTKSLLKVAASSITETMNNEQFRRLLFEDQSKKTGHDSTLANKPSPVGGDAARSKPAALGSNMRPKIPMTPRSVIGVDFASQSADHRRVSQPPPAKKFRSSAAPKGTKLAEGYQDRTLLRRAGQYEEGNVEGYGSDDRGDDDRENRVRALEDMVKLGQVDQPTFEKLREEIGVGGDVESTHLIKGLDWKLLRRVKAGEDINAPPPSSSENGVSEQPQEKVVRDIDEEFDMVLEEKEKEVKEPAQKRSEDSGLLPVDKHAKPLGMDVPAEVLSRANAAATMEEEDDDIFQGVGRDYNPLADMEDEDDHGSSSSDESDNEMKGNASLPRVDIVNDGHAQQEQPLPQPAKVRDYFATSSSTREDRETVNKPSSISSDPAILAALKRAAATRQTSPVDLDDGAGLDQEATLKRKRFLEEAKRQEREDAMDLDLGFGGSRFGDEDDEEAGWEAEGRGRGTKRKRGPKKKKGDKDSVNAVMKVLEGRRQANLQHCSAFVH
ncbi:predicted protein [Histoplasma mississippiense (nom. inval.)]|uniref:predicted protein n=1 Tax=Ajellomyces capsulatus (strain NAm1 / WU24) TaxID=2059318 RepID=UPI000157CCD9|nr:predicted protein [Histoplasma mississippiense (nom. inval.)]EDN10116.1 predicted protein [Histoplasma mississippiense (nom. inval.)]